MTDLADTITAAIESENIIWLIVLGIISIGGFIGANLKYARAIWDSYELKKKTRLNRLIEADQCKNLDDSLRQFIHEEIQHEHFLAVTGISASRPLREKLIEIQAKSTSGLRFHHFKRALLNLHYENGELNVRLSGLDKFEFLLNWSLVVLFVLTWIFCMYLAVAHRPFTLSYFALFIGLGLASLAASLFFISATRFWFSARKIQKELERL